MSPERRSQRHSTDLVPAVLLVERQRECEAKEETIEVRAGDACDLLLLPVLVCQKNETGCVAEFLCLRIS